MTSVPMDVAGLGLDHDERFVFLGVLGASDQFEKAFAQADLCLDIDAPLLGIDLHARQLEPGESGIKIGRSQGGEGGSRFCLHGRCGLVQRLRHRLNTRGEGDRNSKENAKAHTHWRQAA